MRASHVIRLLNILSAMFPLTAADQGLSAQIPDIVETGGLLPAVSIKTAPEFNRKVSRQLEKPHSIEKGEYPIQKLVEEMAKQSGVKIEVQSFRTFGDVTNFSEAKIKFATKVVGITGHTLLRLICDQLPATYWVADNRVFLVPEGRILNKLIEEAILAQQPVQPRLLEAYFEEIRESRRAKDRTARMIESLAAPVDVEPTRKPLSAALDLVRKKYAINIVLASSLGGKQPDGRKGHAEALDTLVTLPELKGVRLDRLLQILLNQASGLAFDVFSDHILIRKSRDVDRDTVVHVAFNDISLARAVNELVEQSGQAIVVNLPEADRRKLVSMTLLNETLATTVDLLALQVGAEVKRVNRVYVLVKKDGDAPVRPLPPIPRPLPGVAPSSDRFSVESAAKEKAAAPPTVNFIVECKDSRCRLLIAEAAERRRKEFAEHWLGKELPKWRQPCPLKVTFSQEGPKGATSFTYTGGIAMSMFLEGTLAHVLADLLPHEVTHTVIATHIGKPVPRWADEGIATMSESPEERERHRVQLQEMIANKRTFKIKPLFTLQDYPNDVLVLYCQGHSLVEFLVERKGRATLLAFVKDGMEGDSEKASTKHYGFRDLDEMEEAWKKGLGKESPAN